MAKQYRSWRIIFAKYSLEMVQAVLSQCYVKVNIVVDYSAVDLYHHAFSVKALDGVTPLKSTSDGYFPAKRP